jgi:hypothetical protein
MDSWSASAGKSVRRTAGWAEPKYRKKKKQKIGGLGGGLGGLEQGGR